MTALLDETRPGVADLVAGSIFGSQLYKYRLKSSLGRFGIPQKAPGGIILYGKCGPPFRSRRPYIDIPHFPCCEELAVAIVEQLKSRKVRLALSLDFVPAI